MFFSLPLLIGFYLQAGDHWSDILARKNGKVVFYWYPNNVSVSDSKDIIDGIEHDLAFAFVKFINERYDVSLEIDWIQTSSFQEVMELVRTGSGGVFGTSSISITPERQTYLNFTPPYLADVAVLVSNSKVPIARTPEEFKEIFQGLTAVSIPNTTLLEAISDLEKSQNLKFTLQQVQNSGQIIDYIGSTENTFGYIDLPNFLVAIDDNSNIRRQFFHPIKLKGLGMIYPKDSDWEKPVNDYFKSSQFQLDKNEIIVKYLGEDVSGIIERISKSAEIGPFEEIVISNREKELQYEELLAATLRDQEKSRTNNILILVTVVAILILLLVYISNVIKSKANKVLLDQQGTIERRNAQLQALNDEKNDLIKILAHDLRSPLSTIRGMSVVLGKNDDLTEDEYKLTEYIAQSSEKMDAMITKILDVDAIESGKRNLKQESFDMLQLISSIMEDHLKEAKNKDIKLTLVSDDPVIVSADRFYTTQIIENLLSNAIKFSEKGKVVKMAAWDEGKYGRICVLDEGPGFSKEDEKKLFKKYQHLSAKPTGGETSVGLGLSIVKTYTEMMNGKVSYKTKVGEGTEFLIDLPKEGAITA